MNKKMIATIVVVILAVIGGGYALMHKNTEKTLQANEWTIHDEDTSMGGTATFTKSGHMNLSVGQLDLENFNYDVYKKNGNEYLSLQGKATVSEMTTKYLYKIIKQDDSYLMKLQKENEQAKLDDGSLQGDLHLDRK